MPLSIINLTSSFAFIYCTLICGWVFKKRHINRVIKADFNELYWRHIGTYNEALGRVEMHLESVVEQSVMIGGIVRTFARGERIHSENSYKYSREQFEAMLREAGFSDMAVWTNSDHAFWVFYAR